MGVRFDNFVGLMWIWYLVLVSGCANLAADITETKVLRPAVGYAEKINIIAVAPTFDLDANPKLARGYQMSAVGDSAKMNRAMGHAADLFTLNGVPTKFVGSFSRGIDFASLIRLNSVQGAQILFFEPVGSSISSQNGAELYGLTRYRISLLQPDGQRGIEMYDEFSAGVPISSAVDARAARWFNSLVKGNFVKAPPGGSTKAPPHRNFVQEDRAGSTSK
jgi:hypothetical protein